jgi:murein DD-endopeptidase MepM/ murein hydrolase activator NlpD
MGAISESLINKSVAIWQSNSGFPWNSRAKAAGDTMKAATAQLAKELTGNSASVSQMEDYLVMFWNMECSVLGGTNCLRNNGSGYYGLSQIGPNAIVNYNQIVKGAAKLTLSAPAAALADPAVQVKYGGAIMKAHLSQSGVGKLNSDGSYTPPSGGFGVPAGYELATLYLSILWPAGIKIKDPNARIPGLPSQAAALYKNGVITKATIQEGICKLAANRGAPVTQCKSDGILTNGEAVPPVTAEGITQGILTAIRDVAKDLPLTTAEAKRETGSPFTFTNKVSSVGTGIGSTVGANTATEGELSGEINTSLPTKGLFTLPAKGAFTSGFGPRWGRSHRGIDIAAPEGTPLYAAAAGTVIKSISSCPKDGFIGSRCGGGFGNQVIIDHGPILGGGSKVTTIYAHASKVFAKVGDKVLPGQKIALMGDSGSSTGSHLHFEIKIGGKHVNPAKYLPSLK